MSESGGLIYNDSMELPTEGILFRSSPSGWTFFHTIAIWAFATAVTQIYYFLATPVLDLLPPIALWAWAPVSVVALKLAISVPPSLPMARVLRLLVIYSIVLVSVHLILAKLVKTPTPQEWIASLLASAAVVLLLESIYALRRRKEGYAVALFPDRFEYEEVDKLRSWSWEKMSVFWDGRTKDYVVVGPANQEVRLKRDLPGRSRIVHAIETLSGRKCKELL
jgi:hypothetical protein